MPELRWTLLVLGVSFIIALAWWERRRPRQAPGMGAEQRSPEQGGEADAVASAFREPVLTLPEIRARDPSPELPILEISDESLMEPVFASAEVEAAAGPTHGVGPSTEAAENALTEEPAPTRSAELRARAVRSPPDPSLPELSPPSEPIVEWPPDEVRRIIALRLVSPQPERFPGRALRRALTAEGFVPGKFSIFHKPDEDGRAYLSAASLTKPGTFDLDTMDSQRYGGLSLFAVLPGPKAPREAVEELLMAARNLNERLHGALQDERGAPLTPARMSELRESVSVETSS